MDVFFYEVFEEEEQALKHYLPDDIKAGFTWKTIQESGDALPQRQINQHQNTIGNPCRMGVQIIGHSEPQQRLRSSCGI